MHPNKNNHLIEDGQIALTPMSNKEKSDLQVGLLD